jgi:hypothetical protein
LKINTEGTLEIIDNKTKHNQILNSFYIEIRKEKIEKLKTAHFIAECLLKRRLRKNEAVVFKDGNESNFELNNLQVVSLGQQKTTTYTVIPLDEPENTLNYTSISSIARALGIRGVLIKSCIDGLVDKVKSPKTQKSYRFEKSESK